MKAAICTAYGPPEVLKIKEVDRPLPKSDEVLVRIMSASVNSGDARIRGLRAPGIFPLVMRILFGFAKPRNPILGLMFSGIVEEIGKDVSDFKPGDLVFGSTGSKMGAHAEYATVKAEGVVTKKPENASFEEAAALVFGGMSATYFLRKAGVDTINEPKILIYGATGSVGTAAIEIAKHFGAHVTSVCSERGADLAKSLGSDEIVLYTQQDFRKLDTQFDIVFDAVGKTRKKDASRVLKPNGKYLTVGGMDVAKEKKEQLEFLRGLFDNGEIRANIDKTYPLEEIVEAHRYVDSERKKGNVVLKIHS
ncbi:MAG: NAD(P)-dependent alcohol dehydrogenase [Lutimonas sp.]